MKKTMIATVLGLALMPLTFAAQTPAKSADKPAANSTSTSMWSLLVSSAVFNTVTLSFTLGL